MAITSGKKKYCDDKIPATHVAAVPAILVVVAHPQSPPPTPTFTAAKRSLKLVLYSIFTKTRSSNLLLRIKYKFYFWLTTFEEKI